MPIPVGIEASREFTVEDGLLTDVGGTLASAVLSTPGMILMMERTAATLVQEHLPEGRATVGFEVCVKHVRGAPRGTRCTVRTRLREVREERKLLFDVEVVDADQQTVGVGTHERRVVEVGSGGNGSVSEATST